VFAPKIVAMTSRLAVCGLLAAVAAAPSVRAQDGSGSPTMADRAAISSCVRESPERPRVCIGAVAVVCARVGTGDRREAEIACTRREAAVWRERLDLTLRALMQRLGAGPRNRLATVQRNWEEYTAPDCAFTGEVHPPARAALMQSGCELRAVAGRAIELGTLARRHMQSSEPRPRLQR
jgi:uncharacterized protein YecT (DUF1311 family)